MDMYTDALQKQGKFLPKAPWTIIG
jgi:hypothetical protein